MRSGNHSPNGSNDKGLLGNNENIITHFIQMRSSGGIVLMAATALALVFANSPLAPFYNNLLTIPVEVRIGDLGIDKPILLWINDGLMAIFFFYVGLELKRDFVEGELSEPKKIVLPAVGAVGGMVFPALIYVLFTFESHPHALSGWAIPAATDIAFAIGILALLGSDVPQSLRIFLTSLAIFDDIGAIIIIALFYTDHISFVALGFVLACLPFLYLLNRYRVDSKSVYMMIAIVMWVAMLKSGVHATLTGVIVAFFIPMQSRRDPKVSPLKLLEDDLTYTVAFMVLPVFAFTNAGIYILNLSPQQAFHPVPLGIAMGLFLGKQIGVFGCCWLFIRLKWATMPKGMNWGTLYGCAILCGVGFTMSLFIGSLAFDAIGLERQFDERLGIIGGSLVSGIMGYLVLRHELRKKRQKQADSENNQEKQSA